jgi:acyl-coenzyme A synthetase/AMP-(fatty) acid ligase
MRHQDRIASLQYNGIETIEFDLTAAKFGFVRSLLNVRSGTADHIAALNLINAKALVFGTEFVSQVDVIRRAVPSLSVLICVGGAESWCDEYEAVLAKAKTRDPVRQITENDWHSIYFTSGTTARPKVSC